MAADVWESRYEVLLQEAEEKGIRIVSKDNWFWWALHYIVMGVTFGGNKTFINRYVTTLGKWIAVPFDGPSAWEKRNARSRYLCLRHELIHCRQFKFFGFGLSYTFGILPAFFVYVLLPVPIGFAYGRWVMERTAYLEAMLARLEHEHRVDPSVLDHAVKQLSGGGYGWTWCISSMVRKWFLKKLPHQETLHGPKPA